MLQGGWHRLLTVAALFAGAVCADTVVLRSGFRLEADRLETRPDGVRLLLADGGWILVPPGEIARVEFAAPEPTEKSPDPMPAEAAPHAENLARMVDLAADEAGLPRDLIRAVVWAESGFRADAVSSKGAVGLMQLMPSTAAELGVDPSDSLENLRGGSRYLKQLLDRFEGNRDQLVRALAAYNAGPAAVARHDGIPPFRETEGYVAEVVRRFLEGPAKP